MFKHSSLLLLAATLWAACSEVDIDSSYATPAGRMLPAMDDARAAIDIYDELFGQYIPDYEDFGWTDAPELTAEVLNANRFPSPAAGLSNERYHGLFDFNPHNFERPGIEGLEVRHDYMPSEYNRQLIASGDAELVHQQYDPLAWQPAVASTYSRKGRSDVMANQLRYRLSTPSLRAKFERAFELCPNCDDVFTPLSHNDLHKIIEIRFVRQGAGGVTQVSRIFKLIGVDSSGAMQQHVRNDTWSYFGKISGQAVRAKWRLELSGQLAQKYHRSETTYIRLMPVIVRAAEDSARHLYYDGRFEREVASELLAPVASDANTRRVNHDEDPGCVVDCHAKMCNEGRNLAGYWYVQTAGCACSLREQSAAGTGLPDTIYAEGRCEAWPKGVYSSDYSAYDERYASTQP